ncbi:hypothetical protein [Pedobacter sp. WC2423]|uniref:hypothetical protein n=1 Tax=Pedobacter sp. WC2423 TaxID=3234142 RepID=UPI003464F547
MKALQKLSLKTTFITCLALLAFGCGARKVQKASSNEFAKNQSESSVSENIVKSSEYFTWTDQEFKTSDQTKVGKTSDTQISADSAEYNPKTGKTSFKGNVKYSSKSTQNTAKDKKTTDIKKTDFKVSEKSSSVKDSITKEKSAIGKKLETKNSESEGSVFYKPWFWVLAFMLIAAMFFFSKLWKQS